MASPVAESLISGGLDGDVDDVAGRAEAETGEGVVGYVSALLMSKCIRYVKGQCFAIAYFCVFELFCS